MTENYKSSGGHNADAESNKIFNAGGAGFKSEGDFSDVPGSPEDDVKAVRRRHIHVALAFFVLFAMMTLLYPQAGKFGYVYQKGSPWIYETLISPMDFPILKTESEIIREREEKASQVIEYYDYDGEAALDNIGSFVRLSADMGCDGEISKIIISDLSECYERGIVAKHSDGDLSRKVIFLKRDKRITETPALEVYDQNEVYKKIISDLIYNFPSSNADSIVTSLDVRSFIRPNITYDEETSTIMHRNAVDYISPTKGMIYAGQLIVSKGELITSDIEQLLDSYKAEYKASYGYRGSYFSMILSHVLLVAAIVSLVFFAILFVDRKLFADFRKLLFLLCVVLLSFLAIVILWRIDQRTLLMFPFALLALFLGAFFKNSIASTIYVISLIPLLLIAENGIMLFLVNAVTGGVSLVAFMRYSRGWHHIMNAVFVFTGAAVVYVGYKLLSGDANGVWNRLDLFFIVVNSLLSVVLYPLVSVFEKMFGLVSYTRLYDLSDADNKLLKELSKKAPGSFQHSLQVANLAENAVKAIEGNSMLARVGALYHDIGKTYNPSCFTENTGLVANDEYHKGKTPQQSAQEIIRHVSVGVEMGRKNGLPEIVVKFIQSHHGRSMTGFFYAKYVNEGGDPANKAPFTYVDGCYPLTKEEVVVMIADSVEAASRSLKDYSPESISGLVDKIVFDKIETGQLKYSDIEMRQIKIVRRSLKEQLLRIYHGRIAYPQIKSGK